MCGGKRNGTLTSFMMSMGSKSIDRNLRKVSEIVSGFQESVSMSNGVRFPLYKDQVPAQQPGPRALMVLTFSPSF